MPSNQRFRVLAILLGELARLTEYDAEGNRLYQRLRATSAATRTPAGGSDPPSPLLADAGRNHRAA